MDQKGRVASWSFTYQKFLSNMAAPVLKDFDIA